MRISTFAIPKNEWATQVFSVLTQQVKDSARKIQKGIDTGLERKRFNNACQRIESLALEKGNEIIISDKELQQMIGILSGKSYIMFPFTEFENLKPFENFLDAATKKYINDLQASLVFMVREFSTGPIKVTSYTEEALIKNSVVSNVSELNPVNVSDTADIKSNFHRQIINAVSTGTPIGWINIQEGDGTGSALLRHEGIITCLREHLFAARQPSSIEKYKVKESVIDIKANEERQNSFFFRLQNFFVKQRDIMMQIDVQKTRTIHHEIIPRNVQFAFSDGSVSDLFPLYSMIEVKPKDKLPILKAALISCRHFELDHIVETSVIRNSEISRREEATIAEQEKISFAIAKKFFSSILERTGGANVELYHTGLEPAVIGTYRAFLSVILKKENRGKLIITPKVKVRDGYADLKQWY